MRWIACALLFAASTAFSHSLWWVKPTTYSDGTPINVTDSVSTVIEWSDGETFGAVDGIRTVARPSPRTCGARLSAHFRLVRFQVLRRGCLGIDGFRR
jgi:hypothetical protein